MQQARAENQASGIMLTLAGFEWFKDRDVVISTFLYNKLLSELARVI